MKTWRDRKTERTDGRIRRSEGLEGEEEGRSKKNGKNGRIRRPEGLRGKRAGHQKNGKNGNIRRFGRKRGTVRRSERTERSEARSLKDLDWKEEGSKTWKARKDQMVRRFEGREGRLEERKERKDQKV